MLKSWEGMKTIINTNTTKNKSINCRNVNNTEETDPFKQFLSQISHSNCQKIESNIVHTPKTTQIVLQIHQRKLSS